MIYLDNAATSYPKPSVVYDEMDRFMRNFCANPGRGGHSMSIYSGKAVFEAREILSSFFGIKNTMRLCFTQNATEALNIAIKGLIKSGDHVITTSMEHNSVIRPLKTAQREIGIVLTIVKGDQFGYIDVQNIKRSIRKNTKLIVCTLSSNVNGTIMPFEEIGKISSEKGIVFLLDASQGAGSIDIDVEKMNIDMLAFSGHKGLMGPQGTGGLYVREGLNIKPLYQGGTGSNSRSLLQPEIMPDMLESGTLNSPGIIGLAAAVKYINKMGLGYIRNIKHLLVDKLYRGIEEIGGITIYSLNSIERNSGIIAIRIGGIDCTEAACILDREYSIAVRAGLHCAPLAHKTLGSYETGLIRFSIGCFNTVHEINYTLNALKKISNF